MFAGIRSHPSETRYPGTVNWWSICTRNKTNIEHDVYNDIDDFACKMASQAVAWKNKTARAVIHNHQFLWLSNTSKRHQEIKGRQNDKQTWNLTLHQKKLELCHPSQDVKGLCKQKCSSAMVKALLKDAPRWTSPSVRLLHSTVQVNLFCYLVGFCVPDCLFPRPQKHLIIYNYYARLQIIHFHFSPKCWWWHSYSNPFCCRFKYTISNKHGSFVSFWIGL